MSVLYDAPGPKAKRRARVVSVAVIVLLAAGIAWLLTTLAAPRVTATGAELPGLLDGSRWDVFNDRAIWRRLGEGVLGTLQMAGLAAVMAVVIGVLFSFFRTARSAFIRVPSTVVLEFFRGMPVLLMMLFILLVFSSGSYWAGVWALAIYNGAIIGEILRAGVAALPKGQREAGLSIGLTPLTTRFQIEFPQAVRNMLPIIIAQLVVLLKDTALAYVLSYPELLQIGLRSLPNFLGNRYLFSFFVVVLAIYLAMNLTLSTIARLIARRTGPKGGSGARIPRRGIFGPKPTVDLATVPQAGMGGGAGAP